MDRPTKEIAQRERGASGVYRAVGRRVIAQLGTDLAAASARVGAFRDAVCARSAASADGAKEPALLALHEIDTAHEELRVAEEELHAQADEILATRSHLDRDRRIYGQLFEGAPEAYIVTDERGVILQANCQASLLFCLEQVLLVGKPLMSLIAQDDWANFYDALHAVSDTVLRTQLCVKPRKAREPVEVTLSAQRGARDQHGTCIRWILRPVARQGRDGVLHDDASVALHERVRSLEAALMVANKEAEHQRALREQADQRDRDKAIVLAETAHELRSPLGTFAGWLNILNHRPPDEPTLTRAIASMTRGARGMVRIVEDLIDNARAENGQLALKISTLNVIRLLTEVVQDIRPLAQLKKIEVAVSAESPQIEVHGDPFRLAQAFKNIVGNAIEFTPEQGSIAIKAATVDGSIVVAITDNGRGIPSDSLTKIFVPFNQMGGADARPTGLGLGLSIAQRLVELHGGSITAESPGEGLGATFTVRLPLFVLN